MVPGLSHRYRRDIRIPGGLRRVRNRNYTPRSPPQLFPEMRLRLRAQTLAIACACTQHKAHVRLIASQIKPVIEKRAAVQFIQAVSTTTHSLFAFPGMFSERDYIIAPPVLKLMGVHLKMMDFVQRLATPPRVHPGGTTPPALTHCVLLVRDLSIAGMYIQYRLTG